VHVPNIISLLSAEIICDVVNAEKRKLIVSCVSTGNENVVSVSLMKYTNNCRKILRTSFGCCKSFGSCDYSGSAWNYVSRRSQDDVGCAT